MFERHSNRKMYFDEQSFTTQKYVIPYLNTIKPIDSSLVIGEIGCGECGNLKPFLDIGCQVIGIDYDQPRIELAKIFLQDNPNFSTKAQLIYGDIYKINPESLPKMDIIILRDTIEHIPNQDKFMGILHKFLGPKGLVFFGFPPWRMPFGGHQQTCHHKIVANLPYLHLLPKKIYYSVLKYFGESADTIRCLDEIRDTRLSISCFFSILKKNHYKVLKQTHYLFNPNYEIKFKIKPKTVLKIFRIPFIKDFYTMCLYAVVQKEEK